LQEVAFLPEFAQESWGGRAWVGCWLVPSGKRFLQRRLVRVGDARSASGDL